MANPTIVICPAGQWTKVATAVTSGQVIRKDSTPHYIQTIRDTGGLAPDQADVVGEGIHMFLYGPNELIQDANPIDVYVYALGADGKVRVDV